MTVAYCRQTSYLICNVEDKNPINLKKQMKLLIPFVIITAILILISCKKDIPSGNNVNSSLLGKWNVVTDSSFSGIGPNNYPINYRGQSGDYFDFTVEGKVYVKEGVALDTLGYTVISDTTMLIDSFGGVLNGVPETCFITNLKSHTVTITAPVILTPGGSFGRKVSLKR